ncbi:ABC transporter ATP-binding protein [Paraburkholderia silvatlantica]|uniref:Spermidine/putrescine transport system ATP-binding protein n=1 Tax=Paraburkholderia silvatlantica TaxID=321895 RepID=A0A2U1AAA5_9BURK|nr:ABC transporter ATP-binding protein [Paraburkholderia silvatlantica]MBB2928123.1 putative spermidine/putrescine transport system ATP-binding protein [Paraburkholderia silvatlantica]PVY31082.1 putative spermidine/putrescine transport system ATP-binding protein [Paraburkholderia silvatlantica]PXW37218.1 putative spermidine/putrescine transport system ATP-binding protein [Paraburkholderia silvatlantica]PYE19645.1 putative spermidine/putrescine transport system ATP-binding protein [Paraburkholde
MTQLVLQDVTKRFNDAYAVDHVNLSVPDGKLVCFLGPSGCGKTTLMRIIAGLEAPTSGTLTFAGENLLDVPANRRNFGMVFQSLALFPHMTVAQNIAYPLRLRKTDAAAQKRRVAELLDMIQLPHMASRLVTQLSGGQRQRVAIARAIAASPRLLLLDEPLSALDAKLREAMQVEIRLLQQRLGITTIMVTHDQREAMTMADEIVVMEKGRIQQVGRPLEIYRDPVNEFVANFIGLGNILPVTPAESNQIVLPGGQRLTVAAPDPPAHALVAGGGVRLLIRPEDVCLRTSPAVPTPNTLPGRVTFVRDVGASIEATIDCEGFTLTAATTPRETPDLRTGMPVFAHLPPHACKLIAAR